MPSNNLSFKYYFYFNEPFSQAYEINQMGLATKEKAKFLHLKLQSRIQERLFTAAETLGI